MVNIFDGQHTINEIQLYILLLIASRYRYAFAMQLTNVCIEKSGGGK